MIRADKILAFSALLISFGIYLGSLANTVSFFDSGELISGAATLGISHPPGYPLYILTGHIFSYLPIGNLAFRINMCSALFGALAVFVIYFIAVQLLSTLFKDNDYRIKFTAFSTALIFALSLNHWGQTNMSEVYALNTFLVALLIFILILWREKALSQDRTGKNNLSSWLYLFSFLFGLGFGDHHTILVMVPAFLFVIFITKWQLSAEIKGLPKMFCLLRIDIKVLCLLILFFLLGFSVYLYLPIRSSVDIIMNWGDPDTFEQFRWMFLREGYPKGQVLRNWELFMNQLGSINLFNLPEKLEAFKGLELLGEQFKSIYRTNKTTEYTILGFILGLVGILRFFIRGWFFASITVIVLMVLSVGVVIYGNPPKENIFLIEAFHTPTYMVFSLWIGVAAFWLLSLLTKLIRKLGDGKKVNSGITALWMAALIFIPTFLFYSHFNKNNRSNNFIAFDYAVNELKSLTSNAILFTWGDSGAFPLWYLKFVEQYQPNVLLLHTPHLASDWYVDDIPDLKRSRIRRIHPNHRNPGMVVEVITSENYGFRKSYIDYSSKYSFSTGKTIFIPYGIIYKHVVGQESVDTSIWDKYVTRDILSNNILRDLDISKAITIYGFCRYDSGAALLKEGKRPEATREFIEAVKVTPGLKRRIQGVLFPGGRRPAN